MRKTFDFETLYRHVGTICVHATWLEQELEDSVTLIAGNDRVASVVRGQRGSNLIAALRRLINDGAATGEAATTLLALAKRAEKLLDDRDEIVHSVWIKKKSNRADHITGTRTRAKGSEHKEWSLAMLEAVRSQMQEVQIALSTAAHNAVAEERGWGLMPVDGSDGE